MVDIRRTRVVGLVGFVLTAGVSLAACSSSSATPTTSLPNVTRCDRVTAAQVETLLGFTITATPRPKLPSECYFYSDRVPRVDQSPAVVTLDRGPVNASSETWLRGLLKVGAAVPGNQTVLIDGTSAMWIPFPVSVGGGGQLATERTGEILDVSVTAAVSKNPLQTAQSVMELVFQTQPR